MFQLKNPRRQNGVTLIEALIALLVLSIGLVGLGALMLTSLKNVHSSSHYSVASAIVLDFEERLWMDLSQQVASDPTALDANGCLSDDAIGTEATTLIGEWQQSTLADGSWTTSERFQLPDDVALSVGTTSVDEATDSDGTPRGVYWKTIPVTLSWTDGRFDADNTSESYAANIALVCRPTFLL